VTATVIPVPVAAAPPLAFPADWYPDPWRVAPLRWWDGSAWTPILRGPYGEAWPLPMAAPAFVPKGPGIRGGGVAAVGAVVGFAASIVVGVGFILNDQGVSINVNSTWFLLASQAALWVGFVGAVMVASHKNGTGSLRTDYGLSLPRLGDLWRGLTGGLLARLIPLLLLIVIVLAGSGFDAPNGASPRVLGVVPSGIAGWIVVVGLAVVGAPIVEELFFRGLIQGAFSRRVGPIPAIFVTAMIFSVAHILSEGLLAPLVLFPAAVILGYLRHKTGRLAAGMVAHAVFNASMFLLFLVPAFR
jgi:hypothetical protein